MDTPSPQNSTPEGRAANRAAYERMTPALAAWRANLAQRLAQMAKCRHAYHLSGGIELCAKCGQPKKLEEQEDIGD